MPAFLIAARKTELNVQNQQITSRECRIYLFLYPYKKHIEKDKTQVLDIEMVPLYNKTKILKRFSS